MPDVFILQPLNIYLYIIFDKNYSRVNSRSLFIAYPGFHVLAIVRARLELIYVDCKPIGTFSSAYWRITSTFTGNK